jgi:hypothetical protein
MRRKTNKKGFKPKRTGGNFKGSHLHDKEQASGAGGTSFPSTMSILQPHPPIHYHVLFTYCLPPSPLLSHSYLITPHPAIILSIFSSTACILLPFSCIECHQVQWTQVRLLRGTAPTMCLRGHHRHSRSNNSNNINHQQQQHHHHHHRHHHQVRAAFFMKFILS